MIANYEDFKAVILRLTKIDLNSYKERQMKRRIESLISKRGFNGYDQYYNSLTKDKDIYKEFINYITINVSEFYRNPKQWDVLENSIIPDIKSKSRSSIKVWSAACSSGQEPYSLAMLLSKFYQNREIKIIATDIDEAILAKAKAGRFDEKTIAGIPSDYRSKYVINEGNDYIVKDEIKRCIEFKKHNLLRDPYPSNLDLIVCRNVLIYFTEDAKSSIYKNFNKALKKDGVLFVGSTEQIINSAQYNFAPLETFFYRKN